MDNFGKSYLEPVYLKVVRSKKIGRYITAALIALNASVNASYAGASVQFSGQVTKDIGLFIQTDKEMLAKANRSAWMPIKVGKSAPEETEVYVEVQSLNRTVLYRSPSTKLMNTTKTIQITVRQKVGGDTQKASAYRVCAVPTKLYLKPSKKCQRVTIIWNLL